MASAETSLVVRGSGRTKKEAFTSAVSSIQHELAKKVKGTLVRIEPLEISFKDGRELTTTEKFLFLFFKREVSRFELELQVNVRYFAVDAENFPYRKVRDDSSFFALQNRDQGSFFG